MKNRAWTMVVRKGKEVNYHGFDTLEQMNRALSREYNISIEYIETGNVNQSLL